MIDVLFALTLESATFAPGATVPISMVATDCGGANISPELHWRNVPEKTVSLALIVHDPDAPRPGGFYHWALYDLAPNARLATNAGRGYYGPCPPPGKLHHYHFTLYALDEKLGAVGRLDARQLLARISRHIIAQTTLTGLFER